MGIKIVKLIEYFNSLIINYKYFHDIYDICNYLRQYHSPIVITNCIIQVCCLLKIHHIYQIKTKKVEYVSGRCI